MMKHQWESINHHIDPEKEEQLKWLKIEFKNQVKRVIKLTKAINHGNNERNIKNKALTINIVEDFQKQYESLYSLYEDLREQVKKNISGEGGRDIHSHYSSTSDSDSELFYSPRGSTIKSNDISKDSDLDDTICKDLRDQINYLEAHVEDLKLEISTLSVENRELNDRLECKSDEAMQMKEKITRLDSHVFGIEAKLKENESRMYSVKQFEDSEKKYISRISELVAQEKDMKLELDTLRSQKVELERRFLNDRERLSSQVKGLMEQISSLKNELVNADRQKNELKSYLRNKSEDKSESTVLIENLRNELRSNMQLLAEEKEGLKTQLHDLETKIRSLLSTKSELEMQLNRLNLEASQTDRKISELQTSISGKEIELSTERKKFTDFQNIMSTKTESLAEQVKNLKSDLEDKNRLQTELDIVKEECSISKSLVKKMSKSNYQGVEKKVEDMFQEYQKQLDDKYRILSRRIRVTELLQAENKECYRKIKDAYEQQNKELKNRSERNEIEFKNIKDMMLEAKNMLGSLDSVALTFEECSAKFLNRISKASWELQFTKHLAVRKNTDYSEDGQHSTSKGIEDYLSSSIEKYM